MKKLASILAVTLAAGVLATGCGSSSGSASKDSSSDSGKTVIKAATGANAKPYVYVGDDDKPAGYDVDVLNAVFDKLPDYELEYEVTDFGSVLSGLNSGNYQIGVNNFSYNEDRGASYLYSYPYDKISYVFVTKKGGKEIKSFEDAAGLSFEGGTGISVSNAVEAWNEKNPDKAINITYSDADTSVFLQHVADGSQDFTIIDLAMYNSYMEEFNYDVQKNDIPEDEAKMIALALNESAFNAEIIRASLESVDKGQVEAASALGMNYFQALIRIILPEAIVVALPSLGNAFIGLIKGTSLAFVCSVVEMTAEGKILAGRNYRYFEVYISLAIIYWVITFVLERVISYLEKKLRVPEDAPALLDIRDTEVE